MIPNMSNSRPETEGVEGPRVVWVVHRFTSGGIGPVCHYAAKELALRHGWRTTVVALHESPGECETGSCHPRMVALDLPEHDTTPFLDWLESNPQDIIITNDVETLAPCMPHFPKGALHVIQVHDSGARYIAATARNSIYADGIICVAEHFAGKVRETLKHRGFLGPVAAVLNGADFPEIPPRSIHQGPLRLLFMGRMDPLVKGTFDLAEILHAAISMGVDCKLAIAGGFCDRLDSRFKRLQLSERVVWLGRIPHEKCYEIAAASDIFMMTSRKEPFGMVTIEAMAMGCVPIAWDVDSGTLEIIVPGESGLLARLGSPKNFAAAITKLDNDRDLLLSMSRAASIRARSRFTAAHMANDLEHYLGGLGPREGRCFTPGKPALANVPGPSTHSGSHGIKDLLRGWVRRQLEVNPKAAAWALKHVL